MSVGCMRLQLNFYNYMSVVKGKLRLAELTCYNNNNGNLARPTSAEPKALTKTTLHKRKQQPQQYSQ